jgi:hypothetical protein
LGGNGRTFLRINAKLALEKERSKNKFEMLIVNVACLRRRQFTMGFDGRA